MGGCAPSGSERGRADLSAATSPLATYQIHKFIYTSQQANCRSLEYFGGGRGGREEGAERGKRAQARRVNRLHFRWRSCGVIFDAGVGLHWRNDYGPG